MLLFDNDQAIISNTEDSLQKSAYKWNQIITKPGLLNLYRKQNWWYLKDEIQLEGKL